MLEVIQLDETSFLHFYSEFLDKSTADEIFIHLKSDIDWRESYGRSQKWPLPRFQCWMSDPNVKAKLYQKEPAMPWSSQVYGIKNKLEQWLHSNDIKLTFDNVQMNKYRNGYDEADDTDKNIIGSVSFGATRKFVIKSKLHLTHGSLIVMSEDTQINWIHSIPEDSSIVKSRINVTFRKC